MNTPESDGNPSITITMSCCEALEIMDALRRRRRIWEGELKHRRHIGDPIPPRDLMGFVRTAKDAIKTEQPKFYADVFEAGNPTGELINETIEKSDKQTSEKPTRISSEPHLGPLNPFAPWNPPKNNTVHNAQSTIVLFTVPRSISSTVTERVDAGLKQQMRSMVEELKPLIDEWLNQPPTNPD